MLRTAIAASALALALVGCSGDPEPKFAEPSETPSSSPQSPSTSPSPMDRPTPREFFDMWAEAQDKLFTTGEGGALRAISARDCEPCNKTIALVEEIYASGGSAAAHMTWIDKVTRIKRNTYSVELTTEAYRYRKSTEAEWIEVPQEHFRFEFQLRQTPRSWQVVEYVDTPVAP